VLFSNSLEWNQTHQI